MKIWTLICLFILIGIVKKLIDERFEITYVVAQEKSARKHAVCIPFHEVFRYDPKSSNSTTLKSLKLELLNFFRNVSFKRLEESDLISKSNFEAVMVGRIRLNKYFIHNYHFCLLLNLNFVNHFFFLFSDLRYFIFEREPFLFFVDRNLDFTAKLLVVQNEPYPYSQCRKFSGDGRQFSRFECVNDCLKARHRSLQYFYSADETGVVHFLANNSLQDQQTCFDSCPEDCELKVHLSEDDDLRNPYKLEKFKSLPIASDFDFYIQLISIVFLFLNFSLYEKVPALLDQFWRFTKKTEHINLLPIRMATFIVCFILISTLFLKIKNDFDRQKANPFKRETSTTLIDLEPLSLLICVPVQRILLNDFDSPVKNETDDADNQTPKLYLGRSLKDLESLTNAGFNMTVSKIYISIEELKQEIDFRVSPKVYFMQNYLNGFLRCFRIELNPKQMKFQSILQISKLTVKFKHEFYYLYLLPGGQPFTLYTNQLYPWYDIKKVIIKRWNHQKADCLDYGRERGLNCTSRASCTDRCINAAYGEKNASVNQNTIIVKDYFGERQWSGYLVKAVDRLDRNSVRERCKKRFKLRDCTEIYFAASTGQDHDKSALKLNLFYEICTMTEQVASLSKLIFDLLNLQSVLFGFNVLKVLLICFALLDVRFRLGSGRRLLRTSIHIVCLLACLIHGYFWLAEALNGEMINNMYYEMLSVKPAPELVFCFKFNHERWMPTCS